MVQPKDNVTDEETVDSAEPKEPAGRVEFDSRGNSVWRWAREMLDNTSILLKRLENADLALEPTQKVPIARVGASKKSARSASRGSADLSLTEPGDGDSDGGFDPYNSR